jgi:hypothetical protein
MSPRYVIQVTSEGEKKICLPISRRDADKTASVGQRIALNVQPASPFSIIMPVLEDADSVQVALMQVMRLIIAGQLDPKIGRPAPRDSCPVLVLRRRLILR